MFSPIWDKAQTILRTEYLNIILKLVLFICILRPNGPLWEDLIVCYSSSVNGNCVIEVFSFGAEISFL